MDFIRQTKVSRLLDPSTGYSPRECYSEIRIDPLTGRSTRILDLPARPLPKAELDGLIQKSKLMCPFCPETLDKVTPKFMPPLAPRYVRGEAVCFPNAFPFDENCAVTVMSQAHYLALGDISANILSNAMACCLDFLVAVGREQGAAVYQSINWNYMPLAGGSLVHPHLQATASSSPTNYVRDVERALGEYHSRTSSDYWLDLLAAEKACGERFVAEGESAVWLSAFAPLGVFDVLAVMPELRSPADLAGEQLAELVDGLIKVLSYIDALGMYSLNMSLFFKAGDDIFVPHMRICPRVSIPPFGASQINYLRMLHDESITTVKPEDVCRGLRAQWQC